MSVSFRLAGESDLDSVLSIDMSWTSVPPWSREHFSAELGNSRSRFIVAEEAGDVVGFSVVWIVSGEAQILKIAVREDRVHGGIGRGLLNAAAKAAREADCVRMTLDVSEQNRAARGLYETFGFRVVGRRAKYYNDGTDALLMDSDL